MDLWWKDKAIIAQIADWAYELQRLYSDARVLSLGQSPAWVVQSVGMIRKLRNQPANITFIPFTGAFVRRDFEKAAGPMSYQDLANARPEPDRIQRYLDLLGHLRAQPSQIMASPEKVVLTEMIKQGNGLASFFDIWTTNEKEADLPAFFEKIDFCVFDTVPGQNRYSMKIHGHDCEFPLVRFPLERNEAELMEGITPHNRAEVSSSRLVPMYKLSARVDEKGIELIPNKENRIEIRHALHSEIQHREQQALALGR